MKVIAESGARCPMEGKPREYITDSKPVDVPNTIYYRRLIRDGSLIQASNANPWRDNAGKFSTKGHDADGKPYSHPKKGGKK